MMSPPVLMRWAVSLVLFLPIAHTSRFFMKRNAQFDHHYEQCNTCTRKFPKAIHVTEYCDNMQHELIITQRAGKPDLEGVLSSSLKGILNLWLVVPLSSSKAATPEEAAAKATVPLKRTWPAMPGKHMSCQCHQPH